MLKIVKGELPVYIEKLKAYNFSSFIANLIKS